MCEYQKFNYKYIRPEGPTMIYWTSETTCSNTFISTKKRESITLRKKCPYSKLFWSVFSRIRTEYREIRSISPYSVQMRENTDQNNSNYGHFSCSVIHTQNIKSLFNVEGYLANAMPFIRESLISTISQITLQSLIKKNKQI